MWFEPISSWFVALVSTGIPWLKEKTTKTIPADYWANKELYYKDLVDGVPAKERIRRAETGRYYISRESYQAYPTPHRDPKNGKIIIENNILYQEDLRTHGAYQSMTWVKQGKYNLNKEELDVEHLRLKKKYEHSHISKNELEEINAILDQKIFDWHDTEAVRQWKRAYAADVANH